MRAWARVVFAIACAAAASCATRLPPPPPAVVTPKFPEFVPPVAPPGLAASDVVERHDVGWRWLQAGDLRAADRSFSAALKAAPGFYPAEAGLGYVALARKNLKESILHFDRAVVANPRYAPALAGRAEVLLATGEEEEALASLEAALEADPSLDALRSRIQVLQFRSQQQDITTARKLAEAGRLDHARAAYAEAIAASPQSPFLHRELAEVERRAGNIDLALEHANRAAELEPDEPRTHVMLGELYEARGEPLRAADAFALAVTLQPDPVLEARIAALRDRAAFDSMPAEYREIESSSAVTRGQLAALLAVRLDDVLAGARSVAAVLITDTRGHWASPHILSVARAGVMEVYANHTFQPEAIVRRADLAQAASRVLQILAGGSPQLAESLRPARARRFPDVGPGNLTFSAVSLVVEAGVMATAPDGTFQPARPVSGAEAVAAVNKLQELASPSNR